MTATTYSATTSPFRAEWTKLRTLRSTWTTIGMTVGLWLFFAAIVAATDVSQWNEKTAVERAAFDPTSRVLIGVLFGAVILGAMAVRSVTSEHSTGMIRTTFAALPRRRSVVLAKAATVVGIIVPISVAANLVGFHLGMSVLTETGATASLADSGVGSAIVLSSLAVGAVAALGVGLGAIIRHTAAATTALTVATFGSQLFAIALPAGVRPYLPGSALQATVGTVPDPDLLSPVVGLVSLIAYAVVALVIGTWLTVRRDA